MAPDDPEREDEAAAARDALRRLEERLDRASDAAERLMAEAAAKVKIPPAGWQATAEEDGRGQARDLEVIVQVVQSLRELIPPELERRLAEALRELLLAIRALIDWYLDRAEQRRSAPAEVQDIPIL
jgi:hypothetical protein